MDTFIQDTTNKMWLELANKKNEIIKDALTKKGFDIKNFVFNDFRIIIWDGDPFEHIYYKFGTPEEIRIVSIERQPECKIVDSMDFTNSVKAVATYKYY